MNYQYTNGSNPDFMTLCQLLDENLNELVGGEAQREQYKQYNTLESIHDVILLYEDDVPVGCASFKHYEDGVAELKRVFLRKDYRGKGIAKELMGRIEASARAKGYHKMILETGKPLVDAFQLYTRLGYQVIPNYGQYKDMPLSVCMSKEL